MMKKKDNETVLTPEMLIALDLWLVRKTSGMTQEDIAKQLNVSPRTIRRWIALPEAKQYMADQAVDIARNSLGDVLDVLTKRALEGQSGKFMELYLKTIGVLGAENVEVNVQTNEENDRSNAKIESEIDELKRLLDQPTVPDRKHKKLGMSGQEWYSKHRKQTVEDEYKN